MTPTPDGPLYHGHDLDALGDMRNYHDWIVDQFRPFLGGHVVEYGAGVGSITRLLLPHVERLDLVEPSPNLEHRLRDTFHADPRVRVFGQTLEQHVHDVPSTSLDAVVLVNVLEHVEGDEEAIAHIGDKLRPGGHLLIFVPALQFLMSRLDRDHGHFRRYHRRPLIRLLESKGLTILRARYMDLAGVGPWFLFNTLGGSTKFNPRMVRLYDRMIPALRRLESAFPPPIGKNIVLIARRD